ncbi:MAG: TolC family protein [Saprospiraceae bacterium]
MKKTKNNSATTKSFIISRYSTILFLIHISAICPSVLAGPRDSTLGYAEYISLVMKNHPLALQADLIPQNAEMLISKAKSAFDPTLLFSWDNKNFSDKTYYSILEGGLKLPLRYGPDLKFFYDQNTGTQLNPEASLPSDGLLRSGIELPLLQGLLMDRRRTDLTKARINKNLSENERKIVLLDLYFEASRAYWQWTESYAILKLQEEMYSKALERFEAVKRTSLLEDRPLLDTIEAFIQVQNRNFAYMQSALLYTNQKALVSVYLWNDSHYPMEMSATVLPDNIKELALSKPDSNLISDILSLVNEHPALKQYSNKKELVMADLRLNREQFKPQLNLQYYWLTSPVINSNDRKLDNNKWGLQFYSPIIFRKERADVNIAKLKLQDLSYEQSLKVAQQSYKINTAFNEWVTATDQVNLTGQIRIRSEKMLEGEKKLFTLGESSLFMINQREQDFINSNLRYYEAVIKNRLAEIRTYYQAGTLNLQ